MENKIQHGQFYTTGNCFKHKVFTDWYNAIPNKESLKIIEPFAGANSIIKLIDESHLSIPHSQWSSYDIEPEAVSKNLTPDIPLVKADTIKDYPDGFDICITNPPYLAKNSAKRKGMEVDFGECSDLFEVSLNIMLQKSKYVAAIIPESFISRGIFTDRLDFVISLNYEMFDDTDFPVCLAVFGPIPTPGFDIYIGDKKVGSSLNIKKKFNDLFSASHKSKIKFNAPDGILGLKAVDGTSKRTISFVKGSEIPSKEIKVSSRIRTRIDLPIQVNQLQLDLLLKECNKVLEEYRDKTQDVFMTSFKGLRSDGFYRRRLDFRTANLIINKALQNLNLN
jgi:hypothetical protein